MTEQRLIRVLLIEDNPGDARLVRELLMEEGDRFAIAHAGSLREAHDQLAVGVKMDGVHLQFHNDLHLSG